MGTNSSREGVDNFAFDNRIGETGTGDRADIAGFTTGEGVKESRHDSDTEQRQR